jgi:hypothetical protein
MELLPGFTSEVPPPKNAKMRKQNEISSTVLNLVLFVFFA